MFDRRDRIYAELGVPSEEPEDPLDRWRRLKAEREEPQPHEGKPEIAPPTLAEIDQRIDEKIGAEHELMIDVVGGVIAQLQSEQVVGATGPPGPSGPQGEQGLPGKLAMVKLWVPKTVFYAGDVVAYDGGTFQAKRDTGQPPSHNDWTCLAAAGRDGGGIIVRGTFLESATYRRLEVVARNGGSFVALKDAPGSCPGAGWQMLTSPGKRGLAGEKGERGPKGEPGLSGATIREWKIDRARYVATPLMSDGREGPPLELRGLFEQFLHETR